MWPFSTSEPEEKGKWDTPINKARSTGQLEKELSFDEKWDLIQKTPKIYGIIKTLDCKGNEVRLDVGERPNGTPEENKFYTQNMGNNFYFFNSMSFISDKLFPTREEAYEYLLSNEEKLKEFGIYLSENVLNYKIRSTLKKLE